MAVGPATIMNNYRVGRLFQDAFPWKGLIMEVVLWDIAISNNAIGELTRYAANRYAII